MARTPLFQALTRALGAAGVSFRPRALSRRSFLVMSAAAAACRPIESAAQLPGGGIAIIGGGAAGLTAAYRLGRAGRSATIFEASTRFGGRIFTRRDFNEDHQFCELGGELVDTNHTALRSLADELGVGIQRLAPEHDDGEDIFNFNYRLYSSRDLIDSSGNGDFEGVARKIARDQEALLDSEENWTARARELDHMSLKAYLDALRGDAPAWVIDLLDLAYLGEYGLPTDQQSALNLVDMIGTDVKENGFRMFGDSDELFRIAGGSSSLTDALEARLPPTVSLRPRHVLTAITKLPNGLRLRFDGPSGVVETDCGAVVLALPFTKLRGVSGLTSLGLDAEKLQTIQELGYGDNAKVMVGTKSRPWLSRERGFQAKSNGTFYSDRGMQVVWETSRAQPGDRGVLTNFLAGGVTDRNEAIRKMALGFQVISPAIADSFDLSKVAEMFWARHQFTLGSYASAKVGQYTTLLEHAATPAFDGRIQFAGEHTSPDFLGYMNGAVESGERAAAALLARAPDVQVRAQ